jgi:phage gp36-like protein
MPYCTQSDIEVRIGPADLVALADHDGDGDADSAVVQGAITSAEALIDSYLSVRYAVPVAPAPDALKSRAVSLAVYFLRLGRDSVTDDVRAQYRDDVDWLGRVVAGQVALGVEPPPADGSAAPGVRYESQRRLFGRDEPL